MVMVQPDTALRLTRAVRVASLVKYAKKIASAR